MQTKVLITERPNDMWWIGSQILDVNENCIYLMNRSQNPIHLKKHQHIADIYSVEQVNTTHT